MATPAGQPRRHRPDPVAIDEISRPAGLHAVAVFEASKGLIVLGLGLLLLIVLHDRDAEDTVERLLLFLHFNLDRHLSQVILHAASNLTDARLWAIAGAATAYCAVRFTEAWGLWKRRVWAEWFALLSGLLYLPWEILKLVERPSAWHIILLTGNVVIVVYMLWVRLRACRPVPCEET